MPKPDYYKRKIRNWSGDPLWTDRDEEFYLFSVNRAAGHLPFYPAIELLDSAKRARTKRSLGQQFLLLIHLFDNQHPAVRGRKEEAFAQHIARANAASAG